MPISRPGLTSSPLITWIALSAISLSLAAAPANAACRLLSSKLVDQTACLREHVRAAARQASPRLALPPAYSLLVSSSIEVPSGMTLDGRGATLFSRSQNYDVIRVVGSNVTIKNVAIVNENRIGADDRLLKVAIARGASGITISNVTFKDAGLGGKVWGVVIESPYVSDVRIENSLFDGVQYGVLANAWLRRTPFTAAELLDPQSYPKRITVTNNRMHAIRGDGINLNSPIGLTGLEPGVHGINDAVITGNEIEAPASAESKAGFCIALAGARNVVISKNVLHNCKWQGVHIEDNSRDVVIEDNRIFDMVGPAPADRNGWGFTAGIWAQHSTGVRILRNWIAQGCDFGVRMDWDGVRHNSAFVISGNRFDGQAVNGLAIWGTPGTNLSGVVSANTFSNIAKARMNISATGVTVEDNYPNDLINVFYKPRLRISSMICTAAASGEAPAPSTLISAFSGAS